MVHTFKQISQLIVAFFFTSIANESIATNFVSFLPNDTGLNDLTPVDPVVGNNATTLGQQRQNVIEAVHRYWENTVNSSVDIQIVYKFGGFTEEGGQIDCTGLAETRRGAQAYNFTNAILSDTWYPTTLANSLAGIDLLPGDTEETADTIITINTHTDIGGACGASLWYGIGGAIPPDQFSLFEILKHEIGHALGFESLVNRRTGELMQDMASIYTSFLFDHQLQKLWPAMSNSERLDSFTNVESVTWVGGQAVEASKNFIAGIFFGSGQPLVYAPEKFENGSSITHWEKLLSPNELMEPDFNQGTVNDLTIATLSDMGWALQVIFSDGSEFNPDICEEGIAESIGPTMIDGFRDEFGTFGTSVSGNTLVVSARLHDQVGPNVGTVYLYEVNHAGRTRPIKILDHPNDLVNNGSFGFTTALEGDTLAVGVNVITFGDETGGIYVFDRDEGGTNNWGEIQKLTHSDMQDLDGFGNAVDIDSELMLVGAQGNDRPTSNSGAAYLFQRDTMTSIWSEVPGQNPLVADDTNNLGALFGSTVALNGNTALIGAHNKLNDSNEPTGAAYVFEDINGNWLQTKKLTASTEQAHSDFGRYIALDGDTIAVTAPFFDIGSQLGVGAVYIFERNLGGADNWGESQQIMAEMPSGSGAFGNSVALRDNLLLIGEPGENKVHVYNRAGGIWQLQRELTPCDNTVDGFGWSLSDFDESDKVVVGTLDAEKVYVFDLTVDQ